MSDLTDSQRRRHVERLRKINGEFRSLEKRMSVLQARRGEAYVKARKAGMSWVEIAKESGGISTEAVRQAVQRSLGTTRLAEVFGTRRRPEPEPAATE